MTGTDKYTPDGASYDESAIGSSVQNTTPGPRPVTLYDTNDALAAAEQRYRALVRATSSMVWGTAPDGDTIDNPEWRTFTGQSVEEAQGWGWLEVLHPDDRKRTAAVWQHAVDTGSLYENEYRLRRRDGVYVWHQTRGVPIREADGSVREWVGVCLNIDLRKRAIEQQIKAEAALRALNEELERRVEAEARERARIWNVSQDMLVVADRDGKILNLNPAWSATLGWSASDLVGKTPEWLLHPDDRKKTVAALAGVVEGKETLRFENRLRCKDSSFRLCSWMAVPDRGLIYAVVRDITAIRAAEDEVRSSRQELAHVNRHLTMGAITASIAHELNQPLGAIVNNAQSGLLCLADKSPNLIEAAAALKDIVSDGHRASQVITSIRAMFAKDAGSKTLLDINELLQEVVALLRAEFNKQNVVVALDLTENLPQVLVDRVQILQVLLNLMINAIDATSAVINRERRLRIRSEPNCATGVSISLEDTGMGVDPKNISRIFESFFSTKPQGMGMGLSICRSIIEAHNGRLGVEFVIGEGSVFRVSLPIGG